MTDAAGEQRVAEWSVERIAPFYAQPYDPQGGMFTCEIYEKQIRVVLARLRAVEEERDQHECVDYCWEPDHTTETGQRERRVLCVQCSDARVERLTAEVARLRAQTGCTLGVGRGDGKLFVHGDYESIKAAQAIIFRAEEAETRERALVEALTSIKGIGKTIRASLWSAAERQVFEIAGSALRAALTPPPPRQRVTECGACVDGIVRASNHSCGLGDDEPRQGVEG